MKKKNKDISNINKSDKTRILSQEEMQKRIQKAERLAKKLRKAISDEEVKKRYLLDMQKILDEEKRVLTEMLRKSKIH